ncbi:NACHT domain-containing protein [Acidomonas methanolica]|uniref:hypothetical protein n=1 Tax=Acidomonas methanolica TaxID=437 RepID=UPI00211A7447|nr:hypothetical protein [Acidomonas methanolica]MCQ9156705.1 hypothetical protein [Acidomonas methanolica]
MFERDLRPFADPATEVDMLANDQSIRVSLTRDGENYVVTLYVDTGHVRLQATQEGDLSTRDFANIRSLLASPYFSNIQVLADNQRRLLESQRVHCFIEPEGNIDGQPLTLETFKKTTNLSEQNAQDKPIGLILLDGSAGVGKTSLISQIVLSRAEVYGREGNQPPVLHVANRGRRLVSLDELIALSIQLVRGKFTYDQVPPLVRHGVLQIAIDGFDELVDADGYADTWSVLRDFLSDIEAGGPIILAGRDTFFDLTKFSEKLQDLSARVSLKHASLSPITPSTAKAWLTQVGWSPEDLTTEEATELLKPDSYVLRPYFLSTMAPLGGISSVIREIVSPRDFLVRSFLQREAKLIVQRVNMDEPTAAKLLWELFELIALEMAEAETEAVDLPFLQLAVDFTFERALKDPSDLAKLRHKAGSFALMDIDARQGYRRFPHTEISNHFLSSALVKEILSDKVPRFLRRGYFGTDFLQIVGEQMLELTTENLVDVRSKLRDLTRNDLGAERLTDNAGSLLITSAVADSGEEFAIEQVNAGDAVLFGTAGLVQMTATNINRLDCRGADIRGINFYNCSISTVVVDDRTSFGENRPHIDSLMVEINGHTSSLYDPNEIDAWITSHQTHRDVSQLDNEATKLLEKVTRVFLRQFFVKSDPLDPAGRYLEEDIWPAIEEVLTHAGRLRRTDRKDASGKRGEFVHIVNPSALLERASQEDREIWNLVSHLV